jgi:hypothetical protein
MIDEIINGWSCINPNIVFLPATGRLRPIVRVCHRIVRIAWRRNVVTGSPV